MSLIKKIIREYPESIEVKIEDLTFIFKPIKDASSVWLARKKGLGLSQDTEKGRTRQLWGDATPESGEVAMIASIMSDFCVAVKGVSSDGEEIVEHPTIIDFLVLAKNDYQRFAELADSFYSKTSFNKVASSEFDAIEEEKKISETTDF